MPMPSRPSSGAWPGRIPRYPFLPGTCKSVTSSRTKARSGVATSRESVSAMGLLLLQFRRLLDRFLDGSLHIERLFGQVVVLAFDNFAEALDGIGQGDVLTLVAGKLLGDVEGLGEELLDFAGAGGDELVIVGVHVACVDGGDGALVGGGDALMQFAHFGGEVGLVADGGGHAAEEGGNF